MARRKRTPRAPAGAPPGTLPENPNARPTHVELYEYSLGKLNFKTTPDLATLQPPAAGVKYWLNVEGLKDHAALLRLKEIFKIHHLALEDVVVSQRPKIEQYNNHMLFLAHMPSGDCSSDKLEFEQVAIFYGKDYVLTFQDGLPGDCFKVIRRQLEDPESTVRCRGADYLAYRLLDAIIDHYFPLIEQIDERIDKMEEVVFTNPTPDLISRVRTLKRQIAELERRIRPVLESLRGREQYLDPFTSEETRLEIRDCLDHSRQLTETLSSQKEFAGGLIQDYMSSLSYKTNEIMRALTLITTVFMPLSLIAGIYGMNFEHMPELKWMHGYPFALGLMLTIAIGFYFYFRKKGWTQ